MTKTSTLHGRVLRWALAATVAATVGPGCIKTQRENPAANCKASACNECHTFPGASSCQINPMTVNGAVRTRCVECHGGSIALDSAIVNDTMVRFDAMMPAGDALYPRTSALHANGTVDLTIGQCIRCHANPPTDFALPVLRLPDSATRIAGHDYHCRVRQRECLECHFTSIAYDKSFDITGADTMVNFQQKTFFGLSGDLLPAVDPRHHHDKTIDVVFKRKYQELPPPPGNDTLFLWNAATRTCSNVSCHGVEGMPLYHTSYWGPGGSAQ
jgi:predicted CxxxxCH...CXXCH cytochrome family protein